MGKLFLPSTEFDYERAVGDGTGSSIVMACALWLARVFPEAPLRVRTINADGQTEIAPNHPLQILIERPNDFYSGVVLWMATLIDFLVLGNAYWIMELNDVGDPVHLWYTPAGLIEPKGDEKDLSQFITHYDYKPDPSMPKPIILLPDEVMHFRYGIDSRNVRKGLSPIASLLREIFTDNEAANFSASLLRNLGIPGVILSPSDADGEVVGDDLDEVKEAFKRRFTGDRRGEPLVMRTKTDVKVLSFSPQEMDLRTLRRLPEERVTAVLGIPAVVVGFGAGLDRSTFANFAEAREAAQESFIAPLQRLIASEITLRLLPRFQPISRPNAARVETVQEAYFDTSQVRILQEDTSRKSKWVTEQFENGLIDRHEARLTLGRTATEADKVYRIPKTVIEVPSDKGGVPYLTQLLASGGSAFGDNSNGRGNPKPATSGAAKKADGDAGDDSVLQPE